MGNFNSCSDVFGMILLLLHDHHSALQTLLSFQLHAVLFYLIRCILLHYIDALMLHTPSFARCRGQFEPDSNLDNVSTPD